MNINERAAALAVEISRVTEGKVLHGPFSGMKLPKIGGCVSPYFLGTYEHELHNIINDQIIRHVSIPKLGVSGNISPYKRIMNVGCGFGYYACGLARSIKEASVHAYDTDEICVQAVKEMAELNGLTNVRAHLGAPEAPSMIDQNLIFMDVEGAEEDLLQPGLADVLVESHECVKPGITNRLIERFAPTHKIDIIRNSSGWYNLDTLFPGTYIEHFDHAIATWEGRAGETPWLWMVRKNDAAS